MKEAERMSERKGWHQLNQYSNVDNPGAHFKTTGPEIWGQTEHKITHFVAGLGTCGTITGTGRYLKQQNPSIQVLGVAPCTGHDIPGVRSAQQLLLADHYHPDEYNGQCEVNNHEAYKQMLRINQEESLICGPTSGMALAGVFKMVPDAINNVVVVMFPD